MDRSGPQPAASLLRAAPAGWEPFRTHPRLLSV